MSFHRDRDLDRSSPPVSGSARPFSFPPPKLHRASSGLEIITIERSDLPMVGIEYLNRAGGKHNPVETPGLASFTASLLDEGTSHRTSTEISEQIERLGGHLIPSAGWECAAVSVAVLQQDLDFGIELLQEIVLSPSFPESEVERIRRHRLAELARHRHDPSALASRHLLQALYPDSAYGNILLGTRSTLEALGRDDLEGFWRRHLRAEESCILAVGALPNDLFDRLEAQFSELGDGQSQPTPEVVPRALQELEVHLVERKDGSQTELRVAHPSIPRKHPDRVPMSLMNSILGGKFTSRLNLNLREKHGYTYGVHSQLASRSGPGPFVVSAAVATESAGAATREILTELHRIRDEAVEASELDDSRNYLLGVFPYTLQTLQGLLGRLEDLAIHDLPLDYYDTLPDQIRAVSAADIQRVAQTHLAPERLVVVAVGPSDQLRPQLEELGPVTLHDDRETASD